jgi:DME family drug/metabolite transporter
MTRQNDGSMFGSCFVLVAAVLWGTVGPAQVLAGSPMAASALGGWRLLIGGLLLGVFTARPSRIRGLTEPTVLRPLLVCALSTALYQAAFLSSVSRTGAALATVVALGTAPLATGVCARWVSGERLTSAWLASTGAAVAGCVLLMTPGSSRVDAVGLLLAVTAGTCYGLYTVFAKQLASAGRAADLPLLSSLSLVLGALPLMPWMFADSTALGDGASLALIAWLGVVTTAAAYWLFAKGLTRVQASTAGTLSLAEPLAAALIGVLLLHEHLALRAWAGCTLILGGMIARCLPAMSARRGSPRVVQASQDRLVVSAAGSGSGAAGSGSGAVGSGGRAADTTTSCPGGR